MNSCFVIKKKMFKSDQDIYEMRCFCYFTFYFYFACNKRTTQLKRKETATAAATTTTTDDVWSSPLNTLFHTLFSLSFVLFLLFAHHMEIYINVVSLMVILSLWLCWKQHIIDKRRISSYVYTYSRMSSAACCCTTNNDE